MDRAEYELYLALLLEAVLNGSTGVSDER